MPTGEVATSRRRVEAGYTYLMLLFVVVAVGLLTAAAAEVWSTVARRERERELLFVGNQYREALDRYHDAMPAAPRRFPERLEELLRDPRFPGTRRHLRQLYRDPITGQADWVLLRQGNMIVGLHSRGADRPLKQGGFKLRDASFAGAAAYADWNFIAATVAGGPDQGARPSKAYVGGTDPKGPGPAVTR